MAEIEEKIARDYFRHLHMQYHPSIKTPMQEVFSLILDITLGSLFQETVGVGCSV